MLCLPEIAYPMTVCYILCFCSFFVFPFCALQDWQPPFAVDVDLFKFVPRVQRLNELEVSALCEN